MRLKRFGIVELKNTMRSGCQLEFNEWFTLNAGWRVISTADEIIGYVTCDCAYKAIKELNPAKSNGYAYTRYFLR